MVGALKATQLTSGRQDPVLHTRECGHTCGCRVGPPTPRWQPGGLRAEQVVVGTRPGSPNPWAVGGPGSLNLWTVEEDQASTVSQK